MQPTNPVPGREMRLERILRDAFSPVALSIEDESARHAGHSGARPGGETHYAVLIVSEQFRGLGRVERHRQVTGLLADEFATGLHALSLTLRTPDEASA